MQEPYFEKESNESIILHPKGRLDRAQVSAIWRRFRKLLETTRVKHLTLNLKDVTETDTSGVVLFRSGNLAFNEACGKAGDFRQCS